MFDFNNHQKGGLTWKRSNAWATKRPLSQWYGVTTNKDGYVIRLDLNENNLEGKLPSILGKLDHLEELILDHNKLTGDLPASFRNNKLRIINLSHNQLVRDDNCMQNFFLFFHKGDHFCFNISFFSFLFSFLQFILLYLRTCFSLLTIHIFINTHKHTCMHRRVSCITPYVRQLICRNFIWTTTR
jgi:hypothetical protein